MKTCFHFRAAAKISAKKRSFFAEIAQLVEHDLAKVGVASSSLVFRSKSQQITLALFLCRFEKQKTPEQVGGDGDVWLVGGDVVVGRTGGDGTVWSDKGDCD